MPRKKAPTAAELARDKARKQVQNLFDQFKDPLERSSDARSNEDDVAPPIARQRRRHLADAVTKKPERMR